MFRLIRAEAETDAVVLPCSILCTTSFDILITSLNAPLYGRRTRCGCWLFIETRFIVSTLDGCDRHRQVAVAPHHSDKDGGHDDTCIAYDVMFRSNMLCLIQHHSTVVAADKR